jgi:hypothetical protein
VVPPSVLSRERSRTSWVASSSRQLTEVIMPVCGPHVELIACCCSNCRRKLPWPVAPGDRVSQPACRVQSAALICFSSW